jgi:hypothetical protein
VQKQHIEPFILVSGHEHANAIAPQFKMHSLIFDIADTVQAEMGFAFAKEDGADSDACRGRIGFR